MKNEKHIFDTQIAPSKHKEPLTPEQLEKIRKRLAALQKGEKHEQQHG